MTHPEHAILDTVGGPNTLDEIDAALERTWSENPHVPEDVRMAVSIAVAEIGANILEHAGQGAPLLIRMQVTVRPSEVWVEFVDDGLPAHVDLSAVGMPDEMSERGRGLALARNVLGQLTYRRTAFNHWKLVSKQFG